MNVTETEKDVLSNPPYKHPEWLNQQQSTMNASNFANTTSASSIQYSDDYQAHNYLKHNLDPSQWSNISPIIQILNDLKIQIRDLHNDNTQLRIRIDSLENFRLQAEPVVYKEIQLKNAKDIIYGNS